MKITELTGAALDWAVAKCEGIDVNVDNLYDPPTKAGSVLRLGQDDGDEEYLYQPSINWTQGGPIIEREKITAEWTGENWMAYIKHDDEFFGPTPLIAAMRCYIASKLGDEVEVPDGL